MKVAFVTHFCPHYRVKTFELLARFHEVDYFFYSQGKEWYGQGIHGVRSGQFRYEYLPGFQLTRQTRVAPSLLTRLWPNNYDVIVKCINGRFALPAAYVSARLRGVPFVLWTGIWSSVRTPLHLLGFPITRWIYRHADAVAVYGEHVKRYLVEQGVTKEKIFVASHAVDNALYCQPVSSQEIAAQRAKLSVEGRKVVLYLGRFEEVKGLDYLLRAFARLRRDDSVLVLAGDGTLYNKLLTLAQQLGIEEKIRFVGYVPPEQARNYYAIADMFVLPSITMPAQKETWGLVVNEAMNQGVPVIASEAVGAAAGGLVQSGVNGFVVPERDSAALADAMERIFADDSLRAAMRHNARRIVAEWNNETMVKGFLDAIEYAAHQKHCALEPSRFFLNSLTRPSPPHSRRDTN
jgi:glycosyltransferase involved in cell wall biosynthesis